jgi:starch synthase
MMDMDKKEDSIKVLFAVWELEPFLKVGGLGEVARSLPRALKRLEVDIRVIIPHYKAINMHYQRKQVLGTLRVPYGGKNVRVKVSMVHFINVEIPVYLLQNKKYFDKPMEETFAFFAGAVTELLKSDLLEGWSPEIIHCNDNHCGLIPLKLKTEKVSIKTLLTIHCVSHQRKSPVTYALKLGIPEDKLSLVEWEIPTKRLNFLLEGIKHADYVNTVSPTYLKEIQTEEMGAGLDNIIKDKIDKTSAILNGIDYELKDPATNPALAARFKVESSKENSKGLVEPLKAKRINKAELQKRFKLPVRSDVAVISFVGRFDVRQKGIDVLHRMLWREQFEKCQFVIMGHGRESWEDRFGALATFLPKQVAVVNKYDDGLAALMYAGSDFVLIPSHFEPCCLIQMNAMRYGAIPIARATGGLSDTITEGKNGWLYVSPTARVLKQTIMRALKLMKSDPKQHEQMVLNAMQTNFSWDRSAKEYVALYKKILKE